ncbi:50S ribosomal protein L31 [Candidatus Bipolaricaulota bacterium]|nr:50S ribosomal protein L31 [Candidatus Bipolaricaulota bacterium]MBS3792497.1 50S ribosomal protein L31 [Candidatus Bipolaricaulota bacterium]
MKEGIHPELKEVTVKCACGNTFETLSTQEDLHVDVCSNCHPFFSGGDRFLDSEGRISKFEKKYGIDSDEEEESEAEEPESETREANQEETEEEPDGKE